MKKLFSKQMIAVVLGLFLLSGCKNGSSSANGTSLPSDSSALVTGSLAISDVTGEVGDIIPLQITFDPVSVAAQVEYSDYDETIALISDDTVLALKAGETNVRATSRDLSTTFTITISEKTVVTSPLDVFNEYGAITEGLPGFSLTGENVEEHIVENDNDREGHEEALRIYVDESDPAIDFTLTSTYAANNKFPAGDYTLSVELVGNPEEVIVTINEDVYKKSLGDIEVIGGSYKTSYFEFTLPRESTFDFSLRVTSPANQGTWGYIDNIILQEGHVKPEDTGPEVDENNLLRDPGFETAGKVGLANSPVWEVEHIQTGGTYDVKTDGWAANGTAYSLKLNYWPGSSNAPEIEATVSQTFTVTEDGEYELTYFIATGGFSTSMLYIAQEDLVVHSFAVVKRAIDPFDIVPGEKVDLTAGEYTFVIHFKESSNVWAHLDDFLLEKVA